MINDHYFTDFLDLETARLSLRKQTPEDAAHIFSIRSDERVMKYMDSKMHQTEEDSKVFVSENTSMYNERKGLFWVLVEKESGNSIGDFSFWDIDRKNSRAEIGYTLKPEYWGKGYMKEAMGVLFRFGFEQLNLHSFEANINTANEGSRKVLKAMGFQKEAYFRENYFFNGEYLDSEIYCLLEGDLKNI